MSGPASGPVADQVATGGEQGRAGGRAGHAYTLYHPKWYRPRTSIWWWLQRASYTRFIVREVTSVAVAFFAVILLWQVWALGEGPEAHAQVMARLGTPAFALVSLGGLLLVLYHTVTWFNAAPAALVVRVGGKRVPRWVVAGGHYVAWVILSAVVAWVLLGVER